MTSRLFRLYTGLIIAFNFMVLPPVLYAGEADRFIAGNLSSPLTSVPLAAADDHVTGGDSHPARVPSSRPVSMGDMHKVLGYSTLVLAAGAAFSSSSKNIHKTLGYAAAGAATMTCISGYLEYSDYFNLDDGLSNTNIHITTGVAATVGFIITAILGSQGDSHGGIGAGSTVLMAVPIIILKW